ncbi:MAG: DUF4267 domain-containing protein [Myxococcales bacterium]
MIRHVILALGIGRVLLGLAPFVAAGPSARLLGFPQAHDNATSRLMARFFGVRDVGLGVLVFYGLAHAAALPFLLVFNALTDLGDLVAIAVPLVKRQGIDRAAWGSAAFALPASLAWFAVFSLL